MFAFLHRFFTPRIRPSDSPRIRERTLVTGSGYTSKTYQLSEQQVRFLRNLDLMSALKRRSVRLIPVGIDRLLVQTDRLRIQPDTDI